MVVNSAWSGGGEGVTGRDRGEQVWREGMPGLATYRPGLWMISSTREAH